LADQKGYELKTGVVVIGRNEGERLRYCIKSVGVKAGKVVYVDSGSTDNSVELARNMGAEVICLDMDLPFTAARARNAGFKCLFEASSDLRYVQFVDGDCEMIPAWLNQAVNFMDAHPDVAIACGRLRERFPEQSIYNLLCDIEWNTPVGIAKACGGIALVRTSAFESMHGFQESLIAGEEPELCVRLRRAGWKIWRLEEEMAVHDAALTRFSQWWKRAMRSGYAFAEGAWLHGSSPERHWVEESRRSWVWGLLLPIFGLLLSWVSWAYGLIVLMIYFLQCCRLALRNKHQKNSHPWAIAFFLVLGKFPEMLGQVKFQYKRLMGRPAKLIEYK
jgi:GT2 family glycosyltransferase